MRTYSLSLGKDFFTLFKGVDGCLRGGHGSGDNITAASEGLGSHKGRGGTSDKKGGGGCELQFGSDLVLQNWFRRNLLEIMARVVGDALPLQPLSTSPTHP